MLIGKNILIFFLKLEKEIGIVREPSDRLNDHVIVIVMVFVKEFLLVGTIDAGKLGILRHFFLNSFVHPFHLSLVCAFFVIAIGYFGKSRFLLFDDLAKFLLRNRIALQCLY